MYDVIVVGAGPAGTSAAKRCIEYGLKTLIVEKRPLPRDKVCAGMIMGPLAHTIIKQEFGDIPEIVLCQPGFFKGWEFHVPGIGSRKLENYTLLCWRRHFDYWLNQKAQSKGVEIWQGARVVGLTQGEPGVSLEIAGDGGTKMVKARFVIGADGSCSSIRRFLFPKLAVSYRQVYQECYHLSLDLEREYFHWFYPAAFEPMNFFTVYHKDDCMVMETGGKAGQVKERVSWARNFLAENYHFNTGAKPFWRGGCQGARLREQLISYSFRPALGNVLLAGDAGGFQIPVGGEGIGTGIKTGLLAADAIKEVLETGGQPDKIYFSRIENIISGFKEIYPWINKILEETERGRHDLPQILRDAYSSTLRMF